MKLLHAEPIPSILLVAMVLCGQAVFAADVKVSPDSATSRERCETVLQSKSEIRVPCDKAVSVPSGEYEVWLEAENAITPFPTILSVRENSSPIALTLPMRGAGRVEFKSPAKGVAADVLHLRQEVRGAARQRLFQRRLASGDVVWFPEGPAVAQFRDANGRIVSVSKPFEVRAGKTNGVTMADSVKSADVVVRLSTPANENVTGAITASLEASSTQRPPDAAVFGSNAGVAIWYGVPRGPSLAKFDSDSCFEAQQEIDSSADGVQFADLELLPKPTLTVTVVSAQQISDIDAMEVQVCPAGNNEHCTSRDVVVGKTDLGCVSPGDLVATLTFGKWHFKQSVRAVPGQDAAVLFDLSPVRITGRVTLGRSPVVAEVAFTTDERNEVRTDAEGRYSILLWQKRRYGVAVKLPDHPTVPLFTDTVRVSGDQVMDFDIPDTDVQVRAIDRESGKEVAAPVFYVKNIWTDAEGKRGSMVRVVGAQSGPTQLPPMRPGSIEITAEAPGYATNKNPVVQAISENSAPIVVDVPMTRSAGSGLTILLPNGMPAVGARVCGIAQAEVLWMTTADEKGFVRLPPEFAGTIGIFHPSAAIEVRRWDSSISADDWQLKPPAPPLRIRVTDRDGRPADGVGIAMFLGGARLAGSLLGVMTGAPAMTASDGTWTVANLPSENLAVLAYRLIAPAAVMSGAYDTFAVPIAFPWAATIPVPLFD